ncbi:Rrf2 family transcriptional regulator [Actinocorallia sp. A-T 12471]|uniref:Rrf2 family transcriptional regulator n=1 Tax=Actinocorallia sp. A-T 12471 TaxID=3089813 RepID=UPI0029D0CACF|nr:Rrf2 family transcriptional regulator [Actinocorallia sp. A-T 12471]MDX6744979.1 Rrf2 family transcriptional regulator [Actinocorallia sp. A-T 12471]
MAQATNTRFSVAVHLATLLADRPGELVDSGELAISPATNPAHVRRVLGRLRAAGLVHSVSGPKGGWALSHPPESLTLADIWTAINADDPVLGVHLPNPSCPVGQTVTANLHTQDALARQALLTTLSQTTIATLLTPK